MSIQEVMGLLRRNTEIDRPWRYVEVADTSAYRASGAGYIAVLWGDVWRRAIYRDGPVPAVGSFVQARETASERNGALLALPLVATAAPLSCHPFYYFLLNGSPVEPLGELPPSGTAFGGVVRAVTFVTPDCRAIWTSLRTYACNLDGTVLALFDEEIAGPIDGEVGSTNGHTMDVSAPPHPPYVYYYIQYRIAQSPPPPPLGPGDPTPDVR